MTATVSLLLPVLNEESHIDACIESLRSQDYPHILEILVAEGGSEDDTRGILDRLATGTPPVVVVANPDRNQAPGLNRLIEVARGEVAVRIDAHTTYARDYVRRCVEALEATGAAMVGGSMRPTGMTPTEEAIAGAMTSIVAVGTAKHRQSQSRGEADTVYLGALRLTTLRDLGGYRWLPSGVAEDADLAFRVRAAGGRVIIDPAIVSTYRPRGTLRALWRQFWRYGRGKADMLYAHRRFPSLRPMAPLALVVGLTVSAGLGITTAQWFPLLALGGAWLVTIAVGVVRSMRPLRTGWAVMVMHLSYGLGLIRGLVWRGRRNPAVRST